jgi:hypothetical protein
MSDLSHFEKIISGTRLKSIAHMLKDNGEHTPSHPLAEFDHARCKAMARLCESLYDASWNVISACDSR